MLDFTGLSITTSLKQSGKSRWTPGQANSGPRNRRN